MKFFNKGDVLATEGDPQGGMFILVDGGLAVFKGDIKIAEFYEKGAVVGEMSIILNKPRTATIKAEVDSHVIEINTTLDEIFENYPEVAKKIIINLSERLMYTTEEYWLLAERFNIEEKVKKYI